jgi:hypothetical protein
MPDRFHHSLINTKPKFAPLKFVEEDNGFQVYNS